MQFNDLNNYRYFREELFKLNLNKDYSEFIYDKYGELVEIVNKKYKICSHKLYSYWSVKRPTYTSFHLKIKILDEDKNSTIFYKRLFYIKIEDNKMDVCMENFEEMEFPDSLTLMDKKYNIRKEGKHLILSNDKEYYCKIIHERSYLNNYKLLSKNNLFLYPDKEIEINNSNIFFLLFDKKNDETYRNRFNKEIALNILKFAFDKGFLISFDFEKMINSKVYDFKIEEYDSDLYSKFVENIKNIDISQFE